MAEYIERAAALHEIERREALMVGDKCVSVAAMKSFIKNRPAADVAPVVRCKDCKHKGWIQEPCHGKTVDFCNVWDACINNPDKCFCYYGEAKQSIQ